MHLRCCFARNFDRRAIFSSERGASCQLPQSLTSNSKKCRTAPGIVETTGGTDVGIEGAESAVRSEKPPDLGSVRDAKEKRFPRGSVCFSPSLSLSFFHSRILRPEPSLERKDGARKECTTKSDAPFSRCKLFALFPAQPEVREMARRESGSGRPPQRERTFSMRHATYPSCSFLAPVPPV